MKPAVDTQVFETIAAYHQWREKIRKDNPSATIGLVPTMGALHAGHGELIKRARAESDFVVVWIFVNPLQFAPHEDLDRYPRTFPADLKLCQELGADAVFHPSVSEIYPQGAQESTKVIPPERLAKQLEGEFRPHFFTGVATVVLKFFNMLQPTQAYFGEKDYQQLTIVKQMVSDLNLPISIRPVATVREQDGLAMSSRNVYLTEAEREIAPKLHEAISTVSREAANGADLQQLLEQARKTVRAIPNAELQYLESCDAETLQPLREFKRPMVTLVACKIGNVRLIDNVINR
jgi:pantoate ligase/cytidylate kinase